MFSTKNQIKFFSVIFASTIILLIASFSFGAAGDLDASFGNGGIAVNPIGKFSADYGYASALQSDGKIVVAGRSFDGVYSSFAVSRLNPDGSLDSSFGVNGKAVKRFFSTSYALAVAVQPDGKIIAAGFSLDYESSFDTFTLVRFNADGSIDNSFGQSGVARAVFGGNSSATSIAFQTDGKIIVAGFAYGTFTFQPAYFAAARFNADGTPDSTFDADGKLLVTLGGSGYRANSVVVQTDGKIVIGGGGNSAFTLFRLNADGSLDISFEGDGRVTTPVGSNGGGANSLTLQTDGKIVAAGSGNYNNSNSDVIVVRYNGDGSLDTSFDADGIAVTDFNNRSDNAAAVEILPDGKIAVAGSSNENSAVLAPDFIAARYNADGSPDASFDNDGKALTAISSSHDQANDLIVLPDGKIILAGFSFSPNYEIALVRYNADGSLDATFNGDGISLIELSNSIDVGIDTAIQTDGKIVVVGYSFNGVYRDITVVRYLTGGALDASFGNNGVVVTSLGNLSSTGFSVVIQPDNKILVGGSANPFAGNADYAVLRYNPDGSPDSSFGAAGRIVFGIGTGADNLTQIALQADGKIVAAGYSRIGNSDDVSIARLNADGSLDISFDGDGKVTTAVGTSSDRANAVAIQSDEKIVVAGFGTVSSTFRADFVLVRYNADGSLDATFDGDGKVNTPFKDNNEEVANALVIQNDGKIVAAGQSTSKFALSRYNPDGSLDTSFDTDGKVTTDVGGNSTANQILDLAIQTDGKLVAAGTASTGNDYFDAAVARYNLDGSLDNFFGNGGIVVTPIGNFHSEFIGVSIQTNGKIVAAGYGGNNADSDFAVARYEGGSVSVARTKFDFDGDGKADISVFRPSSGTWYLQQSQNGFSGAQFGASNDRIVPADYDGDGKTDIAVFRPSSGMWYLNRSRLGFTAAQFGAADDLPVPDDYDGDGKTDLAVFRPSDGVWYIRQSTLGFTAVQFGASGDQPVPADYDGDGKIDIAVFRPSNGAWYLNRSQAGFTGLQFGEATDKTVPADYDGDGKADLAVFRPGNGAWYLLRSNLGFAVTQFGTAADLPTPADYDGDGKTDIAVFRPSNGAWYLQRSDAGFFAIQFGTAEDKPIPNSFIR